MNLLLLMAYIDFSLCGTVVVIGALCVRYHDKWKDAERRLENQWEAEPIEVREAR